MINIPLNDNYKITSDRDQYIICKMTYPKKEGVEPYWKQDKFFGSLKSLLRYIPEFLARQENHRTLLSLKKGIDRWRDYIKEEIKDE